MLPHTGLFLLGKVALQMRIRRCSRQKLRQSTIQHSHTGNLEHFGRRIHRLRISYLFKSSQRYSPRMGRCCHFTRRRRVPNRLDLHPAWRRRLVTSNMMIMSLGRLAGQISSKMLLRNWVIVCMGNLVGALAMAFFLGYYVGMIEGSVAEKTIAVAEAKIHMDFGRAFVSAVACNWMVCMGAWLHFAAKNTTGRMLAIWFPVMIFVLNGFQHLVANMFVIPAGVLAGANITWGQFFFNMIPVFLGNVVGGASFVGASYLYTYKDTLKDSAE